MNSLTTSLRAFAKQSIAQQKERMDGLPRRIRLRPKAGFGGKDAPHNDGRITTFPPPVKSVYPACGSYRRAHGLNATPGNKGAAL
jgi:hypothetical protein